MGHYSDKDEARQVVWDRMNQPGVASFPFPAQGRIPNFVASRRAAERLFEEEPWRSARRLKVNPDAPQRPVRLLALQRGITVYMPTPRLRAGFLELDPTRIPPEEYAAAVSLSRGKKWQVEVPLQKMPPIDAIVTGSVAVTPAGARCGKGAGYADLEYAILCELGLKPVPVATTVHDVQLVTALPVSDSDLPLHCIVTPTQTFRTGAAPNQSRQIDWDQLSAERIANMPPLQALRTLRER